MFLFKPIYFIKSLNNNFWLYKPFNIYEFSTLVMDSRSYDPDNFPDNSSFDSLINNQQI